MGQLRMARKDVFGSVLAGMASKSEERDVTGYAVRGASRSIMQSFEELSKGSIVELDPALIDGSFVSDRLDETDEEFQELVSAIREHGQDSPILVRPHPSRSGRYQTVFGHRRVKAAKQLGRSVRAVVKTLDDRDHVIAQGQENAARANLSFIEKTLFAEHILAHGHDIDTVKTALALDDTTVSKMRSVSSNVPSSIVQAIGAAKGIGRDRWWQLSKLMERPDHQSRAIEFVSAVDFASGDSETRFNQLFAFLSGANRSARKKSKTNERAWTLAEKSVTAKATDSGKAYTLVLKSKEASKFGAFISERLDTLFQEFKEQEKAHQKGD